METKTKVVIGIIGATLLAVVGFVVYKKHAETSDATDTLPDDTAPSGNNIQKVKTALQSPSIIIHKAGSSIFNLNPRSGLLSVARKTKTNDEKVGEFKGYRTINGNVYAYFYDKMNGGIQSFVLKSLTNLANLK